jgi:hypothetical protein
VTIGTPETVAVQRGCRKRKNPHKMRISEGSVLKSVTNRSRVVRSAARASSSELAVPRHRITLTPMAAPCPPGRVHFAAVPGAPPCWPRGCAGSNAPPCR